MIAKVEQVTPAKAKQWLKQSDNIRKPNKTKIAAMVRDLKTKHWENNGESIKFRRGDGALVDGQNRLHAIAQGGATVPLVIVREIDADKYIDIGERRTLAQVLRHEGIPYANGVSQVVSALITYQLLTSANGNRRDKITQTDRLEMFAAKQKQIVKWTPEVIHYAPSNQGNLRWHGQMGAVCVLGTCPRDYKTAKDDFLYYVATGEELTRSDPCYQLRQAMHEQRRGGFRYPLAHRLALVIRAWNHHRRQAMLDGKLAFRSTGKHAEDFPVIQ